MCFLECKILADQKLLMVLYLFEYVFFLSIFC
jgi:hypothetical protein